MDHLLSKDFLGKPDPGLESAVDTRNGFAGPAPEVASAPSSSIRTPDAVSPRGFTRSSTIDLIRAPGPTPQGGPGSGSWCLIPFHRWMRGGAVFSETTSPPGQRPGTGDHDRWFVARRRPARWLRIVASRTRSLTIRMSGHASKSTKASCVDVARICKNLSRT